MKIEIIDAKPQVGIFEIVENVFLKETEDVQPYSTTGEFFDGTDLHMHSYVIPTLVENSNYISEETKDKFKKNRNEYLNYPRGRVDYNTKTHKYHIMSSRKFFTEENIERVTREFHLPPYSSNNVVLESDENHYGY